MFLPDKIRALLADEQGTADEIGMSAATVHVYQDRVLKVQECSEEAENEYRMMRWLRGKLPVPEIYAYEEADGRSYLLMSRCRGSMACDRKYMEQPEVLCRLLADGLKKLWSVPVSDCPTDQRLSRKLEAAKYNVEHGLVDLDNVEPDTFGENGFRNPEELLQWLSDHKPEEEPVLSHGDYCLPNLFGVQDRASGYIDLGRMGVADKWCDIALCYRSLSHNVSGKYGYCGDSAMAGYDDGLLFRELGLAPDQEKLRYYRLLDELF